MDKTELQQFFEIYIEQYLPFKDSTVFKALTKYLVEYYYDIQYNQIPEVFKSMFENYNIPQDIYDQLLISIGFNDIIIEKLSLSSKMVLLQSFSDFQRYRASIKYINNLGSAFNDKVSYYELFIDWDNDLNKWILKPYTIYEQPNSKLDISYIEYERAYNEVPSLLVSIEQLDALKENDSIILPIKSNLLLMNYNLTTDVSLLYNIIISTMLKECGTDVFHIYLEDRLFSTTFEDAYFLWYWLAVKYYQMAAENKMPPGTHPDEIEPSPFWQKVPFNFYIKFHQNNRNPYLLVEMEDIINEYNLIDNRSKLNEFYSRRVIDAFGTYYKNDMEYNEDDFGNIFATLDGQLKNYIDSRIQKAGSKFYEQKMEIKKIVDELYNSFILFFATTTNNDLKKYGEIFLSYLPQLTIKIEDTVSYVLLYNSKPYHTELLTKLSTGVSCEDKFNSLLTESQHYFLFELMESSFLEFSDEFVTHFILNTIEDPILNEKFYFLINYYKEMIYSLQENIEFLLNELKVDLVNPQDQYSSDIRKKIEESFPIIDYLINNLIIKKNLNYNINDISLKNNTETKVGLINLDSRYGGTESKIQKYETSFSISTTIPPKFEISQIDSIITFLTQTLMLISTKVFTSNNDVADKVNTILIQLKEYLDVLDVKDPHNLEIEKFYDLDRIQFMRKILFDQNNSCFYSSPLLEDTFEII